MEEENIKADSNEKSNTEADGIGVLFMSDEKLKKKNITLTKKQNVLREVISWVETFVFAFLIAVFLTNFIIVNAKVPSASMETTIMTGDKLIANRLSYMFKDPERFDIVVFKFPDNESVLYIKRIIGMPGDKVEIKDNQIYINDSKTPLNDSFLHEKMVTENAVYYVPEDSYFMMGDNRNNSADSRFWVNKFVKREKILGKAIFRYYPVNALGFIKYDDKDNNNQEEN